MKLVEILAKELGEWPEGSNYAEQDHDKEVRFLGTHTRSDFFASELADKCPKNACSDGIPYSERVTREMWQAERNKQSCERVEEEAAEHLACIAKDSCNVILMRDRIREIDATIEAMTAERAELVSKLAGEGFALIAVAAEPVEDMSDWRDWRVGDRIEVLAGSECDTGVFAVIELESSDYDGDVPARLADIGWPELCYMRWHSRPTA